MSNSDKNNNTRRRAVVKSIATGAGVVAAAGNTDKWSKPIVNSVMIPAHAQASNPTAPLAVGTFSVTNASIATTTTNSMTSELIADESISEELLEFFLPSAHANKYHCNTSCIINMNASITDTQALFCIDGKTTGSHQASASVDIKALPFPTCGGATLGPINVTGGAFDGTDWLLAVKTENVSTTITITPGGTACTIET